MIGRRDLASLVGLTLTSTLFLHPIVWAADVVDQTAKAVAFPTATVRFEQNATDGDVEVVFEAKGDAEGLARLKVTGPEGRTVIDFSAPDASTLGIRQFRMESPEPKDVAALKAAYPEGRYTFWGTTASGKMLSGASQLSHTLPATARVTSPAGGSKDVPLTGTQITWPAVAGVKNYIVDIDQDELGARVQATLPSGATSFAVPDGFLVPGTEYQLAIGTVASGGNLSFVETTFTTAN